MYTYFMVEKNNEKDSKLDSISFRGNKSKWIDFQYIAKKEGNKNVWLVLEPMINDYVKNTKKRLKNEK